MDETFVTTAEAATVSGMAPGLLRYCMLTFAFPSAHAVDGRRAFALEEVLALKEGVRKRVSVPAAVRHAQQLLAVGELARAN